MTKQKWQGRMADAELAGDDVKERAQNLSEDTVDWDKDAIDAARLYAEAIVETIREPLIVLNSDLRVQSVNKAFCDLFATSSQEAQGQLVYELGSGQWDIPRLRTLLEEVLTQNHEVVDFEVEHDFQDIGLRCMMLNARKLEQKDGREALILLAIEDITARRTSEAEARRNEMRLSNLLEALPGAVYTTDAAGRITSFNPAAARLWSRSPELGSERWSGSLRIYRPDGTVMLHDQCSMARALKEKRPIGGAEAIIERPDGVRVAILSYTTLSHDNWGNIDGTVTMLVDITERKRAEALAERLAAIVASSDDAIISMNPDGTITSWNNGAERLFGHASEEVVGKSIMILIPPDRHDEEADILSRIRSGEHIRHYETVRQHKDGSPLWVSLSVSPLKDSDGKVIGASKISRDMSERRRADQQRKILIGELNHRVKNTLAIVQSIASQTLGQATSLEVARDAFTQRLINLANAHDVLTRENWKNASLEEIVAEAVKPHGGGQNRFRIEGPHVRLMPAAALALSMALHELGTNAAKYGALSTSDGHVVIVWSFEGEGDDRRLVLHWEESGGPEVVPPKRKGFGSRLIEKALAAELGGKVRVGYQPSGLVCTIDAPMRAGQGLLGAKGEQADSSTDLGSGR